MRIQLTNEIANANLEKLQEKDSIIWFLKTSISLFTSLVVTTDATYKALENSITSTSFSSTTLTSYKSTIDGKRSTSQSTLSSLKSTLQTLENLEGLDVTKMRSENAITRKEETLRSAELSLEKSKSTLESLQNSLVTKKSGKSLSVTMAENELDNAKVAAIKLADDYKIQIESKENDIKNLTQLLSISKENLKDIERGATSEQIKLSQNDIIQKQLSLEKTKKSIEKYELIAPFDWVIRKIDFKKWDNLLADEEKFIFIENPDLLEISVLLDQIDVVKAERWQQVNIQFDAHPNMIFEWELWEIDTTPIQQSWVVSYEAKITMHKKWKKIYSWMTATVEIIVSKKEDILIIPSIAIKKKWKKFMVWIKNETWETEIIKIKTWITDWKMTEVIEWLNEWDEIIMKDFKLNIADENNPSFWPGSGKNRETFRNIRKMGGGGWGWH